MCQAVEISNEEAGRLLFLLTDVISRDLTEVAFRNLTELIIAATLLAHNQFATAVAGVKPFRVRHGATAGAIEVNPRPQFDEGTALREFGGFFVFHANPGSAQAVLLRGYRADQNLIASRSGPDLPPVPRGENNNSHQKHRSQYHGHGNQQTFFHGRQG